jgi:hypothetical protein
MNRSLKTRNLLQFKRYGNESTEKSAVHVPRFSNVELWKKQLFSETAMPHSTVIQHLNDEVGYGVARIKASQPLRTRSQAGLPREPCTLCCQITGYGPVLGDSAVPLPTSESASDHILDTAQGPGRRWLPRNQTLSCTVSSRIKVRFTWLEQWRSWPFRLRSRLWLHKIIALDFEMMLRYSGVPSCKLYLICCGMMMCIGPGFSQQLEEKRR